jgi:hypothetical protein
VAAESPGAQAGNAGLGARDAGGSVGQAWTHELLAAQGPGGGLLRWRRCTGSRGEGRDGSSICSSMGMRRESRGARENLGPAI